MRLGEVQANMVVGWATDLDAWRNDDFPYLADPGIDADELYDHMVKHWGQEWSMANPGGLWKMWDPHRSAVWTRLEETHVEIMLRWG